jgi:hypothetical protein
MTDSERNKFPDFFEDGDPDPVSSVMRGEPAEKAVPKKKAGFYLSEVLIGRFNRHFHQMKLAGAPIENKSALLEMALLFALEDLDKGKDSILLKTMQRKTHHDS